MANDSYQLVVRNAPQSGLTPGQVIALEDDVLTLGRDPLSDIILDDPEVSRHHAKLTLLAGGYAIQDMGSTNGSFVDGKRLAGEPLILNPGQVIMLGSNVTLVYQAIPTVDPMATVVAPAAADEPKEMISEEPAAAEEPAAGEEEIEAPVPAPEPADLEPETADEPEVTAEEVVEGEEDDFATMMDESPFVAPPSEVAPEPEPLPEIEPEPLPELPSEPPLAEEEPFAEFEPPAPPEPTPTFDDLDDRTYIDSAAPVPDLDEMPAKPSATELPPVPPPPPVPEPEDKGNTNRNIIIVTVVVILLICCCLVILGAAAAYFNVFSSL